MSDGRNQAKEGHPPHTLPYLPVQTGGVHVKSTGPKRSTQGIPTTCRGFQWSR